MQARDQSNQHIIQLKKDKSIFRMNTQIHFGTILPSLFYYIQSDLSKLALTSNSMYHLVKWKSQSLTNNKDDIDNNWLKNLVKYIKTTNTKRKILSYPMCSYISLYFNNDTKKEMCVLIKKKKRKFYLYIQNHGKLEVHFSKASVTTCSYFPSRKILRLSNDFKYKMCSDNNSRYPSRQCKICC